MKDVERFREYLKEECFGAYFGGGFGGALMEVADIEYASEEELVKMAEKYGIELIQNAIMR